ncbi:aldose 1-epimerase [Virgibacillus pantothenticus]|uniref:Aldose 1-epimerase n=1 Tax=Virgibacillus pantothenticus TaxID=1473 RepID=A0A0L0QSE6_VIRPA|nr:MULTISPECIES: aldose epimerase family protein [Virgibacillus]API91740.1 galactose mutarotase [Virgibacillus sp. 6R]KNE21615.1 aldose epimerase [Virgibacillus pantothenticus]MBS7427860.1 galactose mutarotase [Virgibacillus sp. 19R1-5]MED3735339.1 galactose mutarotase [Virgibacillus pantothenticus]QTY15954.1 galactose mutarotase [Virgibacillus pantothenticus]
MEIIEQTVLDKWKLRTLINDQNMRVSFLDYGGAITEIIVPDKHGYMDNVVLHYNSYEEYESNPFYMGALIGRVAGRIANASFSINGTPYQVTANEGHHHLHGGINGFSHVRWHVSTEQTENDIRAILTHTSPDGDNGYPGNVAVTVTYILTNDNEFIIDYAAITDKTTPITLTNHSYFNLRGSKKQTIKQHYAKIASSTCLEVNKALIPTGKQFATTHTPFDFQLGRQFNDGIYAKLEQNIIVGKGYDHYFCFDKGKDEQVCLYDKETGRTLTVKTTQPGMVLYTGNYLHEKNEHTPTTFLRYQGVCIETQGTPASLEHKHLPSIILAPGEAYQQRTAFCFGLGG